MKVHVWIDAPQIGCVRAKNGNTAIKMAVRGVQALVNCQSITLPELIKGDAKIDIEPTLRANVEWSELDIDGLNKVALATVNVETPFREAG